MVKGCDYAGMSSVTRLHDQFPVTIITGDLINYGVGVQEVVARQRLDLDVLVVT